MRTRTSLVLAASLFAGTATLVCGNGTAEALEPSTKGPLYVQGALLGGAFGFGNAYDGYGAYRLDVEFGAHFTGRHDGFVVAGRQAFYFGWGLGGFSIGTTVARLGYDIPIVIKEGKYEITIAPYGIVGIGYGLCGNCGGVAFNFGFGVEGRFFPMQSNGFYAFARPIEFSFFAGNGFATLFSPGLGVGYAF